MTPPTPANPPPGPPEARALESLRLRYREDRERFSPGELAHLTFLRWLYETGRIRL